MKDYSNHKSDYAIIDYRGMFAIVEVNERSIDDESEIVSHKPDTLSLSKSITTLQKQINEIVERESTPMVSGLERWKEAKVKQRRIRARIEAK
jgi:hypothetical protein